MKFFSYESKFSQLLLKLCYACYLNLLWFVCSIPIVTIGASTTALYYAALKVVRDEDSHVGAAFFRSFRQNFRQATVLWLILLGIGAFLGVDGYILYHLRQTSSGTVLPMENSARIASPATKSLAQMNTSGSSPIASSRSAISSWWL